MRYKRRKDGDQSVYWTASKRVAGKYESVYLGEASADTDHALRRVLAKTLREKLEAKGLTDTIERDRDPTGKEGAPRQFADLEPGYADPSRSVGRSGPGSTSAAAP